MNLQIKKPTSSKPADLHLINCKLNVAPGDENKSYPVEQYFGKQWKEFKSNNSSLNPNRYKASFRGRPLNGTSITLPEGYVFTKVTKKQNDKLVGEHLGQQACYWNLDKFPSNNDALPQTIQWLNLSEAIHAHTKLSS